MSREVNGTKNSGLADQHAPRRTFRGRSLVVIIAVSVVLFVAAFALRFLPLGGVYGGLSDDHFATLIRAEHILDGELPLRDFVDAELRAVWPPLNYFTSAAAQLAFGRNVRSEVLLTTGILAIAAVLTFLAAAALSGSVAVSLLLTCLSVALLPSLYNYPKIILYALHIAGVLWFLGRPSKTRVLVLSLIGACAFLFRHDHLVLISISTTVAIVLVGKTFRASLSYFGSYASAVFVLLLPGIVFVQLHGGILDYVRSCFALVASEADRTTDARGEGGFSFEWSTPLVRVATLPKFAPPINIRWAPDVDSVARQTQELRFGLSGGKFRERRTWSYRLSNPSTEDLMRIVNESTVEDTSGFDRASFEFDKSRRESTWKRLQREHVLFRVRLFPGFIKSDNALPWLRLIAWLCPLLALATILSPWRRRMTASVRTAIASISVLSVGMNIVFVRVLNIDRIADVSVPAVVLGAWLVVVGGQWAWSQRRVFQIAFATLFVAFMLLTSAAVLHASEFGFHLTSGRVFEGFGSMRDRAVLAWHELGRLPRPANSSELKPGASDPRWELVSYLRTCTRPSDRLFVGAYAPQLYYFSERRFAAGQSVFVSNFYTSSRDQQLAIDRLHRQSVPIAVVESPRSEIEAFWSDYPILADYVNENYKEIGETVSSSFSDLSIFVVRDRLQTGIYGPLGLPCFG